MLQPESNMRSFNVEKCSVAECLCSLLALLVRITFFGVKIFNGINFLVMIKPLILQPWLLMLIWQQHVKIHSNFGHLSFCANNFDL